MHTRLFVWLDRAFWAVWAIFPVMVWLTLRLVTDQTRLQAELGDAPQGCFAALPIYANLSPLGQTLVLGQIGVDFALLAGMMTIAHRIVRACARDAVFLADTLRAMGWLGGAMVAYAFVELVLGNLLAYALWRSGDLATFEPELLVDFPALAFGLLILTLRLVVRHAIALKRDLDLTI